MRYANGGNWDLPAEAHRLAPAYGRTQGYAPNPMYRSISQAIPLFEATASQNVRTWSSIFCQFTVNLSPEEKLMILFERVRGRAATWLHDQHARSQGVALPAEVWLYRLEQQFAQSYAQKRTSLVTRTQALNEDAATFCADIDSLLNAYNGNMDPRERLDWLTSLMHPNYRTMFRCICPMDATWEVAKDALAEAMRFAAPAGALVTPVMGPPALFPTAAVVATTAAPTATPAPADKSGLEAKFEKLQEEIRKSLSGLTLIQEHEKRVNFRERRRDNDSDERGNYRKDYRDDRRDSRRDWSRDRDSSYRQDDRRERGRSQDRRGNNRSRDQTPGPRQIDDRSRDRSVSAGGTFLCHCCGGRGHRKFDCPSNPDSRNYVTPRSRSQSSQRSGNEGSR